MNITVHKQTGAFLTFQQDAPILEAQIQELEDAYAECLGDDVDAKTLTMLWLKIKAIKKEITLNKQPH